jgi:hypothetical protein
MRSQNNIFEDKKQKQILDEIIHVQILLGCKIGHVN